MYFEGPVRPYTAGEALEANRVVQLSTNVVYQDATAADPIGVTEYKVASGETVGIRHLAGGHTVEIECAGDIAAEAVVYAAADGKIQALPAGNGTYQKIGIALEAGVEGAIIEVLPYDFTSTTVVNN